MAAMEAEVDFDELLLMLKETRGFDFTGYKRSTLQRRIRRRMAMVDVASFSEYRDYLELQPDEFGMLFDSMLINVTSFFRDPLAWQSLREKVLPELLSAKTSKSPIRVWSAGCATGEEAYTLAMVLTEALGPDQFRERVKIYATDLDEEALHQARAGSYDLRALADVPEHLRDIYFESTGTKRAFRRDLRRQVIFGRNDLTRDAPISRVDLLVARNTLMYFNAEAQANVIRRFHFALSYPGYLFLGKAEMLLNHADRFVPVDLRKRLFRKAAPASVEPTVAGGWTEVITREPAGSRIESAALASGPIVQLAVDLDDRLRVANAAAEALFNLRPRDVGRPFQDLEVSFRPVELRSRIEQVRTELRPVELHDIEWQRAGGTDATYYDVSIVPLFAGPGDLTGVGISFIDVTRYRRVRDELAHANTELERAYEELQSLNEELETTNEELQSTNEELETTNEELQSGNEELETMNEEMRVRTAELDEARTFLEGVLSSVAAGVVVLDADLTVRSWNKGAEELWGLRAGEVANQPFFQLDFGLPTGEVHGIVNECLTTNRRTGPVQVAAINRIGRTITCIVTCSPLKGNGDGEGAVLLMEEVYQD
jgi:two-component system CheB/CheR fusion protein